MVLKKKISNKLILAAIFLVCTLLFVSAVPLWQGTGFITPLDNISTENNSMIINVSFSEPNLQNLVFNWNGVNFTHYNLSLEGMYNLNNLSALGEYDSLIFDSSPYSRNGTVFGGSNLSWSNNGKYGGCFNFTGNYAGINLSFVNTDVSKLNNFSIALWLKAFNKADVTVRQVVYSNTIDGNNRIGIQVGAGNFGGVIYNGSSYFVDTGGAINNNVWYHGVFVYNGTGAFYLNTVRQSSNSGSNGLSGTAGQYIGIRTDLTKAFNGSIDNFMIFNYSLTPSEINQLYISNLEKYNQTQWYLYLNESLGSTGIYNYYAYASNGTDSNQTSLQNIYYCLPAPNENWIIDEGNCNVYNSSIGNINYNITITNSKTLHLYDSNLSMDMLTIINGSKLIKSNLSELIIH